MRMPSASTGSGNEACRSSDTGRTGPKRRAPSPRRSCHSSSISSPRSYHGRHLPPEGGSHKHPAARSSRRAGGHPGTLALAPLRQVPAPAPLTLALWHPWHPGTLATLGDVVRCVVPLLLVPLLIVLALVALVPIALVQRYRMGTARQRARGWLATINVAGIALSAAILLASAALASVWVTRRVEIHRWRSRRRLRARHGRTLAHAVGARTGQASLHAESVARAGHYSARDRPNPVRLLACVAHVGCDCRRPRLVCDDRSGGLDGRGSGCAWVLPGVLDWCPQSDQAAFGAADAMITAEQAVRRAAAQ